MKPISIGGAGTTGIPTITHTLMARYLLLKGCPQVLWCHVSPESVIFWASEQIPPPIRFCNFANVSDFCSLFFKKSELTSTLFIVAINYRSQLMIVVVVVVVALVILYFIVNILFLLLCCFCFWLHGWLVNWLWS